MPFWAGPLRERGILGTMAPARASAITRAIVREYFGQELLGQRSSLLAGEPVFPEATVNTFSQSRAEPPDATRGRSGA